MKRILQGILFQSRGGGSESGKTLRKADSYPERVLQEHGQPGESHGRIRRTARKDDP